ncbi:methyltransferase domain-containing protein [Ancylobacter dichloromethanicus]|uniref:Methyltransferase n=1 Tax=Ancylobacter dichloromethanicus TaxID=518825 RepID=A0A9W6J7K0_9HYPH|nr:methyltransferase domain-containing protein [Ancylobacter dichloromethanicus]MBS7555561.1 methyltransferase domain-containing protein [Ancylobacter dichloromethanicus]GLK70763.1 methyltransferase [Ancylobacter dichloromethanicus]
MSASPTSGSPLAVFDPLALARRRARARALGPETFLLERVAEDLVDRLGAVKRHFGTVADLGTPTRALRDALAGTGMIDDYIAFGPAERDDTDIVTDPEILPFAPASLDLVISALALQSVNDLPGVLAQIRRALRPDGLLLAGFLGGGTLGELREAFAIAESDTLGGISPRVAPFVDLRDLGGLLQRAGLALPVTDVDRVVVRYGDPLALLHDLRRMGATNPLTDRRRAPLLKKTLIRLFEVYAERFADADGRLRATFEIVWVSGWAPHESQQKPLRPGSAKTRLADALNVPEGRLKRDG